MYNWMTPITNIRGIGPLRAKELQGISIHTVGDLLEYQPLHYIYPGITNIADAKEGYVIIKAKVVALDRLPTRVPIVEAKLRDDSGECTARWYNQQAIVQYLRPGMTVIFWGKMSKGMLQQPKFTTVLNPKLSDVWGGFYGVHNITIRTALEEVLAHVELPIMIDGLDRVAAFNAFHFPTSKENQQWALECLKFDEALCHQFIMAERRKNRLLCPDINFSRVVPWSSEIDKKIQSSIPFALTYEQQIAAFNIASDMASTTPMARLLHGEVGAGKSAVMFYAAMLVALNHKRTLILCPTTILAQQHYDTLQEMGWHDVGLHGMTTPTQHIVVGTHSILNDEQLLVSASLIIIDEMHKFGVEQRAQATKYFPHLLLVSATPIPRTLSLSVFGDLDVSTIREQPTVRGQVITRWVFPDKREAMYQIIERELRIGHQAYVVYPRIGNNEQEDSAYKGFNDLRDRFGFCYKIALLTGKHKNKTEETRRFLNGQSDILVSTIISEVGLDNSNATVMVIEGADRFGLSQLHQLRGRICRSKDTAYCFLVAETANQTSIARLEVIECCNNGFEIAEHDLRLRGPGEMLGTTQHGVPEFKFLSLVDDYDIMVEAKNAVKNGLINDGVHEMAQLKYGLKPRSLA